MIKLLRKSLVMVVAIFTAIIVAACGDSNETTDTDELDMLDVDFDVPETAEVDESIELEAYVTYGDEAVPDADEVDFEIWEMCDKDNSEHETPTNNDDGTYTLEYTFEEDGIYEVYAHTTAHDMHTMPKKEIKVGEGGEYDCEEEEDDHMDHEDHDDHEDDADHEDHD